MKLHDLHPTEGSRNRHKRVGRGDGSNWGGTAGRGHKGHKSRTGRSIRHHFEGGQTPYFRRLPKRGFKSFDRVDYLVINLSVIDKAFSANEEVDAETLMKKGVVCKSTLPLKVLGNGEITKSLKIKAAKFSEAAKSKIEAAGGVCETV